MTEVDITSTSCDIAGATQIAAEEYTVGKLTSYSFTKESKHNWSDTVANVEDGYSYTLSRDFKVSFTETQPQGTTDSAQRYIISELGTTPFMCKSVAAGETPDRNYAASITENLSLSDAEYLFRDFATGFYIIKRRRRTVVYSNSFTQTEPLLTPTASGVLSCLFGLGATRHASFVCDAVVKTTVGFYWGLDDLTEQQIVTEVDEQVRQLPCLIWPPAPTEGQLSLNPPADNRGIYNPTLYRLLDGGAAYYYPQYLKEFFFDIFDYRQQFLADLIVDQEYTDQTHATAEIPETLFSTPPAAYKFVKNYELLASAAKYNGRELGTFKLTYNGETYDRLIDISYFRGDALLSADELIELGKELDKGIYEACLHPLSIL